MNLLIDEAEKIPPHLNNSKKEIFTPIEIIDKFKRDLVSCNFLILEKCNPKNELLVRTALKTADDILLLLV